MCVGSTYICLFAYIHEQPLITRSACPCTYLCMYVRMSTHINADAWMKAVFHGSV